MGHIHSVGAVQVLQSPTQRIFGMNVGSGVDKDHRAMDYAKNHLNKPVISAGIVIDGKPIYEIM